MSTILKENEIFDLHVNVYFALGNKTPSTSPELNDEYRVLTDEFKYELIYDDVHGKEIVSNAVGLTLHRIMEHKSSSTVILHFQLVLTPSKSFK